MEEKFKSTDPAVARWQVWRTSAALARHPHPLSDGIPACKIFRLYRGKDVCIKLEQKRSFLVGRSATADIFCDEVSVSWEHAMIRIEQEGTCAAIVDLASTNGTHLNGILLKQNVPYRLQPGDRLTFANGKESFLFLSSD